MMNYDVAIFGSGFAAYELARILVQRGKSIAVIERGGHDPRNADPNLSRISYRREPILSGGAHFGARVPATFDRIPRYVGLGGTSELWSGKWRLLDAMDFQRSSTERRWPLAFTDLEPYYAAIRTDYDLADETDDVELADYRKLASRYGLRLVEIYEQDPPLRLQEKWAGLQSSDRVKIVTGAVLAEAVSSRSRDRLLSVRLETQNGDVGIDASDFIIACGGIESVHFAHRLFAAGQLPPTIKSKERILNQYTGFMDHPKGIIGEVIVKKNHELLDYIERRGSRGRLVLAFSLPERELADDGIGNHAVFLWPVAKTPVQSGSWRAVICMEQFPEDENAIIVEPAPSVSWRISGRTWRDLDAFLERFIPRFNQLLGTLSLNRQPDFCGASHHAGALPMGIEGHGFFTTDCRFNNAANLYCVSSALFPIAGSANPTLTIVALAHRLACHLAGGR